MLIKHASALTFNIFLAILTNLEFSKLFFF